MVHIMQAQLIHLLTGWDSPTPVSINLLLSPLDRSQKCQKKNVCAGWKLSLFLCTSATGRGGGVVKPKGGLGIFCRFIIPQKWKGWGEALEAEPCTDRGCSGEVWCFWEGILCRQKLGADARGMVLSWAGEAVGILAHKKRCWVRSFFCHRDFCAGTLYPGWECSRRGEELDSDFL